MHHKVLLIILIIFSITVFLRIFRLFEVNSAGFLADQVLYNKLSSDFINNLFSGNLSQTDLKGSKDTFVANGDINIESSPLYSGALFTYFYAIVGSIISFDLEAATVVAVLFNLISIILLFAAVRNFSNLKTAVIFIFLLCINYWSISSSLLKNHTLLIY